MLENILSNISKIDEKTRYYILGGGLVLIFLADYFVVMNPQLKTLGTINSKILQLSKDFKTAKEEIGKTRQYHQEVVKFREQLKKDERRIIKNEEVNSVLEAISRMAREENIRVDQIMPIVGSEKVLLKNRDEKYYSLPIMVTVRCGYHDLGRFLNRVENGDIFLDISDFSIAASSDDSMRHAIKITFKVVAFEKVESQDSK